MKRKNTIVMLRVSALTALVVASTLGAVAFFAAPAEGAENNTPHQMEVTQNEETQGEKVNPGFPSGKRSAPDTQRNGADFSEPERCYITVMYSDAEPEIHPRNTIAVNGELCSQIGLLIFGYYYNESMKALE